MAQYCSEIESRLNPAVARYLFCSNHILRAFATFRIHLKIIASAARLVQRGVNSNQLVKYIRKILQVESVGTV
jgi:hypothetical protein